MSKAAIARSTTDIFRAAKLLIDQHGEDAALRAALRAGELLEEGDVDGSAVWRRILAAVEELRRGRREGESLNREGPVRLCRTSSMGFPRPFSQKGRPWPEGAPSGSAPMEG